MIGTKNWEEGGRQTPVKCSGLGDFFFSREKEIDFENLTLLRQKKTISSSMLLKGFKENKCESIMQLFK